MPSLLSLSFFAMQWTGFSLLLKDFSVSDSLRRSCPQGSDTGLRTELALMDHTEVWGGCCWLRVGASANQVGQGSEGNIIGKRNSEQVMRSPGPSHSPTTGLLPDTEPVAWSLWVSSLPYKIGREKNLEKKTKPLKFIKLLSLESLHYA